MEELDRIEEAAVEFIAGIVQALSIMDDRKEGEVDVKEEEEVIAEILTEIEKNLNEV